MALWQASSFAALRRIAVSIRHLRQSAPGVRSDTDLIAFFSATLLLTPLQSAGEEYGLRGLVFRVVGSWTRGRRTGLIARVLVSSALFTAVHASTDPNIVVWYFVLFTCVAIITWRTGGPEIVVLLHALLNTASLVVAPMIRTDLGIELQNRAAGAGCPISVIVITAII